MDTGMFGKIWTANDMVSPVSPSLYLVICTSTGLCIRKPTSGAFHTTDRSLDSARIEFILQEMPKNSLNMIPDTRRKRREKGINR